MQAYKKNIHYFIFLLQGGFAGLLLGLTVRLLLFQVPEIYFVCLAAVLLFAPLGLGFFFRRPISFYLFSHFSFNWIHFLSPLLYGIILLFMLLPGAFGFAAEEAMLAAWQFACLFALFMVLAESQLLDRGLLQKIYAELLFSGKEKNLPAQLIWLVSLTVFFLAGFYLFLPAERSLSALTGQALLPASVLFLLLLAIKIDLRRLLSLFNREEEAAIAGQEEQSCYSAAEPGSYFAIEQAPGKSLQESSTANRPFICSLIRQIPLIDKTEELIHIRDNYLPNDKDLAYTIDYLLRLGEKVGGKEASADMDLVTDVEEVKAYIRTVSLQGNPLLVQKLLNDNRPEVKKAAMRATVNLKEPGFIPAIVSLLKDPEFAFTAMEALCAFGSQCIPYLRSAKYRNKNNSFFLDQCLEVMESYKSPEARDFLIELLSEPQKRFQYKAALALLKNKYLLSGLQKNQILHFVESLMAVIAMQREVLCTLGRRQCHLQTALEEEEAENIRLLTGLLTAFVGGRVIRLLESRLANRTGSHSFMLFSLVDLYFPLVLRTKCKIVLGSPAGENIAKTLQAEYLQEQVYFNYHSEEEAARQVLKMDYSQMGYWLRVCALKQLAQMPEQQVSLQILGEVFNSHPLLQEVASEVLYDLNYDYYFLFMQRLPAERAKVLRHCIETHKIRETKESPADSKLLYHRITFLRSLPLFRECSFEQLAGNIGLFSSITFQDTNREVKADPYQALGYWLVAEGELSLFYKSGKLLEACSGDVIDMSFLAEADPHSVEIRANKEITIYFIEYSAFNKLYLKSVYFKNNILHPRPMHRAHPQPA